MREEIKSRLWNVSILLGILVLATFAVWFVIKTGRFNAERRELAAEAEKTYHSLGREVADKILYLARPWLLAQPADTTLRNLAEQYGEFSYRADKLPDHVTIFGSYESPGTLIDELMIEFAFSIKAMEIPLCSSRLSEAYEVAGTKKSFAHALKLQNVLFKFNNWWEINNCDSRQELEVLRKKFQKDKAELEWLLNTGMKPEQPLVSEDSVM